jgi:hypothetical protein
MLIPIVVIVLVTAIGNNSYFPGFFRRGDSNAGGRPKGTAYHCTVAAADGRAYRGTGAAAQGAAQDRIGGNPAGKSLAHGPGQQGAKKQGSIILTHLIYLPLKQSCYLTTATAVPEFKNN